MCCRSLRLDPPHPASPPVNEGRGEEKAILGRKEFPLPRQRERDSGEGVRSGLHSSDFLTAFLAGLRLVSVAFALCAASVAMVGNALAAEEQPLRVCMQSHEPPLSERDGGEPRGFDVALSRLIAERLSRPLAIQWFITRIDPDANPPIEANALLSDGRCELVAGYALIADALGRPRAETGKLPPFEGRTPDDRRRLIRLGELVATRPYRFDALAVVLSSALSGRSVRKLADIADLKLGVQIHSLADLIAMSYAQGRLAEHVVHFMDAGSLFEALRDGKIDAAFVGLHQFDAWRLAHPEARETASGYTHSVGFNIGFVGLASNRALIAGVDAILADLLSRRALASIAEASGITYLPPRPPDIAPSVPLAALSAD